MDLLAVLRYRIKSQLYGIIGEVQVMQLWMKSLIIGIGLGIIVESLIFLSPLFDKILWETFCTFAKVIPIVVLYFSCIVGLVLAVFGSFLMRKKPQNNISFYHHIVVVSRIFKSLS